MPIDANYVATRFLYQIKHAAGVGAKVDDRNVALASNLYSVATMWQDVLTIICGTECTNPAIEEL